VLPVGLEERSLVDTEGRRHEPDAVGVIDKRSAMSLDGVHDCPPARTELVGDPGDGPGQLAHLAAGLDTGTAGEHRSRRHVNRALGPGLGGARELSAAPAALGPDQACWSPEAGEVAYVHADAVLALGQHATAPTPCHRGGRLDRDHELVLALGHAEHLETVESEQLLREASTVTHVRGPSVELSLNNSNDVGASGRVGGWSATSRSPVQREEPVK
jgi:hypothetical protein